MACARYVRNTTTFVTGSSFHLINSSCALLLGPRQKPRLSFDAHRVRERRGFLRGLQSHAPKSARGPPPVRASWRHRSLRRHARVSATISPYGYCTWSKLNWSAWENAYLCREIFQHFRAAVKWVEAHLSDPESNKRQGTPIARKKPAASTVECEASLFGTEAPRDHSSAQFSNDRVWRKFALFSAGLSLGFFVASRVKSSR